MKLSSLEREKPKIKCVLTELADESKIQLSNHWPDGVVCNGVQLRHLVRSIVISTSTRLRQTACWQLLSAQWLDLDTSFARKPSVSWRAALLFVPALFLAAGSFCFATSQIPTFLGRNQCPRTNLSTDPNAGPTQTPA